MLTRILRGSMMRRRRRKLLSLLAVTLGIAAATAVVTISLDVGDKVNRELRSFGANIAVTPAADSLAVSVGGVDYRPAGSGAYLEEADLVKLRKIFWRNNIISFAPFVYVPARVQGRPVVLVGSWFDKVLQISKSENFRTGLKALHPTWRLQGRWPAENNSKGPTECLVGRRLAQDLGVGPGADIALHLNPSNFGCRVAGILDSGDVEDDQILAPLAVVQRAANLQGKVRRVDVSALTKPEDAFARADVTKLSPEEFDRWYCTPYVGSISYQIQQALPGSEAKPVYRVAATEGKILNRVGALMAILAAAALATAALAVASMMLATVLERRTEIGILKSLGSSDARVAAIFLLEAGLVGVAGGVLGYLLGSLLARRLALEIFGTPADFHWIFFPAALALALLVTIAGSALPLSRGLRVSPATVLRD
jgi:putative ABC transport system permease protein